MKKSLLFMAFLFILGGLCVNAADIAVTMSAFSGNVGNDKTVTTDGFSFSFAKNGGSNNPTYNANGKDVRIYAKGSVTISSTSPFEKVVFNISTQGKKRLAPIEVSTGEIAAQASGDAAVTWTTSDPVNMVTFTVGDTADYGSDSSSAGQLCFDGVTITNGEMPKENPDLAWIGTENGEITVNLGDEVNVSLSNP